MKSIRNVIIISIISLTSSCSYNFRYITKLSHQSGTNKFNFKNKDLNAVFNLNAKNTISNECKKTKRIIKKFDEWKDYLPKTINLIYTYQEEIIDNRYTLVYITDTIEKFRFEYVSSKDFKLQDNEKNVDFYLLREEHGNKHFIQNAIELENGKKLVYTQLIEHNLKTPSYSKYSQHYILFSHSLITINEK